MPAPMNPDLKPVGDSRSHTQRRARLSALTFSTANEYFSGSPFFTKEATRETMEGTQFDGENHRRITPYLQELYASGQSLPYGGTKPGLIAQIAQGCSQSTYAAFAGPNYDRTNTFDVAIIGSGPHGVAVASYLREKRPDLTTIIIEASGRLGGHWANYGPKPVFQMNSRVRKADRRLPNLPRTQGNINPLGKFVPLELSDIPTGVYAWNTDMADVCAINAWLSATTCVVNTKAVRCELGQYNTERNQYLSNLTLETPYGNEIISASYVIDATGLGGQSGVVSFGDTPPDGYFTTETLYKHFASDPNPLEAFHDKNVVIIGRGDGANTALEALIGNLPRETYGLSGVGRMRPRRIDWLGAYSTQANEITQCLRNRYRNGIAQALRRDGNDECGIIVPDPTTVSDVSKSAESFFDVNLNGGRSMYPNVVIDCTRFSPTIRRARVGYEPTYFVGPNNGVSLSPRTQRKIEQLGISENAVSLWATMEQTEAVAEIVATNIAIQESKPKPAQRPARRRYNF